MGSPADAYAFTSSSGGADTERTPLASPNLPAPPNRPIGRRRELEEIVALLSQPDDEKESGQILDVLQKGYRLGDRVLRPARVIVVS